MARHTSAHLRLHAHAEIRGTDIGDKYCATLRTGGICKDTIEWVIDVQVALLAKAVKHTRFTPRTFGFPVLAPEEIGLPFEGQFPSIKMTEKTIRANIAGDFVKGNSMHDTGAPLVWND